MVASACERSHLLTVVLEDYFQVAPLRSVVQTHRWHRFENRVQANTAKALDLLDEFGIKATFFVLGWIADEMPEVVREVARRGHEVASKGYYHRSIRQLSRAEFRDDLLRSREALERASGSRVTGYRIAHGWFRPEDLWALDVLAQEGFTYDSSVRPIFRSFAYEPSRRFAHLHKSGDLSLWELPLSTWSLGRWSFPIAGGNYLRQFPAWMMQRAVARWHNSCDSPLVMYFHVWELDPDQPRITAAPLLERIRQYRNLEKMAGIIRYYLESYRFLGIGEYLRRLEDASGEPGSIAAVPSTAGVDPAVPAHRPAPSRPAVTVVVPCYNESESLHFLANTLAGVRATLETSYELSFVFVDDGSTDGTRALLEKLFGERPDCRVVAHEGNRGVAAAILTGIRCAETEIVCSMDCDCTYDPHQLRILIPMLKEGVDMVTASPYHPEGRVRNVRAWRLVLSRGLSSLYRLVLRHRLYTYTSCFRVYRRSAVVDLPVREGHFLGVAEMLCLLDLRGGRIVECPAVLEVRLLGSAHIKIVRTVLGHLKLLARVARQRWRDGWRRRGTGAGSVGETPTAGAPALAAESSSGRVLRLPSDQDAGGRSLGTEEIERLRQVISSGVLTSTKGSQVKTLERRFAETLGTRFAHACSSGTAAVHAAVSAIDPEPGEEIVTTPITDMGALTPILYQGAIPVFADVDPRTLNVTAATLEPCLSERTRAILVTHLFGNPCEMGDILDLAAARRIPVIEDCAQAYLARCGDRPVGTMGAIGCFSLQQGKHITTGEGGLVVSDDEALARRIFLFINKAWGYGDEAPDHYFVALNSRMSELAGAVAVAQLGKLSACVEVRVVLAQRLSERLAGLAGIAVPHVAPGHLHTYWKYCLRVDGERLPGGAVALAARLKERGIVSAPRYIQKPAFRCQVFAEQRTFGGSRFPFTLARPEAVDYSRERFPGAFAGLEQVLVLPWNERYTEEHVDHIADAVIEAAAVLAGEGR